jgi:hypothetical protein
LISPSAPNKLRIEKLTRQHDTSSFDCGVEALNQFVQRYAYQNQKKDSSQTWLALIGQQIVGYYTLTVGFRTADGGRTYALEVWNLPLEKARLIAEMLKDG